MARATDLATPAPTAVGDRIEMIDALRGFALFGICLVNFRELSLYELLSEPAQAALPSAGVDQIVKVGMAALVDAKAMTVFTLLFGVGFALQMRRPALRGNPAVLYLRRVSILLAIGIVHAFFWWGDILILYALAGFLLVPLPWLRPRTLAILGVLVALFASPALRGLVNALLPKIAPATEASAAAVTAFSGDDWSAMLSANHAHFFWTRLSAWGLPFFTLGRVLLGVALGGSALLYEPARHWNFWRRAALVLIPVGAVLTMFIILRDEGVIAARSAWWKSEMARHIVRVARSGASLALGLGYAALFVLAFQKANWRRWLSVFAPVGRMALTHYLLQTAVGIILFYGVGFGLGARLGLIGTMGIAVILFVAQVWVSHHWLHHFRFGPVEYGWRCLTYGRRFPFRKNAPG